MSRRKVTKTEEITEEFTIVACDICGEEVSGLTHDINGFDRLNKALASPESRLWWRNPLRAIVGIAKNNPHRAADPAYGDHSDVDVHVECGLEAILEVVKRKDEAISTKGGT